MKETMKQCVEAFKTEANTQKLEASSSDEKFVLHAVTRFADNLNRIRNHMKDPPTFTDDQWKKLKNGMTVSLNFLGLVEGTLLVGKMDGSGSKTGLDHLGRAKF